MLLHPSCPRWTCILLLLSSPELFLSVHLLKSVACRCKRVFFPAELSIASYIMQKLLYLISFCYLHTISPFYASQLISLAHFNVTTSPVPLSFIPFFLYLPSLSSLPFFSLNKLVPVSTIHAVHFSLNLFMSCPAILQWAARQLTKNTVRSMIITSPFYSVSTYAVMSATSPFLYLMRLFLLKNMSHICE